MYIEFQDSTAQIYGDLWQGKIPWRISQYKNNSFLVIDYKVVGIKKSSYGYFDCAYFESATDNYFKMVERKPKWKPDFFLWDLD